MPMTANVLAQRDRGGMGYRGAIECPEQPELAGRGAHPALVHAGRRPAQHPAVVVVAQLQHVVGGALEPPDRQAVDAEPPRDPATDDVEVRDDHSGHARPCRSPQAPEWRASTSA